MAGVFIDSKWNALFDENAVVGTLSHTYLELTSVY